MVEYTFSDTPINLSNNPGSSDSPQIAVSGNNVYVVWADQTTGSGDIYFNRSIDGGATFSDTPINLSNNSGRSVDPKIAISGNNVYVIWRDNVAPESFDILFKRSTDNGATFSDTPINLSNNPGSSDSPQIAVSGNNVYVVWADGATGNGDIYFRRSTDDGATFFGDSGTNLSHNIGASSEPKIAATISGSSNSSSINNVYVVWADKTTTTGNADIYFRKSTDGGVTFSAATINLSDNTGSSYSPQITTTATTTTTTTTTAAYYYYYYYYYCIWKQ